MKSFLKSMLNNNIINLRSNSFLILILVTMLFCPLIMFTMQIRVISNFPQHISPFISSHDAGSHEGSQHCSAYD